MDAPIILVVGDTLTNQESVRGVLVEIGFHTLTTANGCNAYSIARLQQPGLILRDALMPGESGFETCARHSCTAMPAGSALTKEETW